MPPKEPEIIDLMDQLAVELTGSKRYAILVPTRNLLQAFVINSTHKLIDPELESKAHNMLSEFAFETTDHNMPDRAWIENVHNAVEPVRKLRANREQDKVDMKEEGWPGRWNRGMAKSILYELSRIYMEGEQDAWGAVDPLQFLGMISQNIRETNNNFAQLAEALSAVIYGGDHGWEQVPFSDFLVAVKSRLKPKETLVSDHIEGVLQYIEESEMGGKYDPTDEYADTHSVLTELKEKILDEEELSKDLKTSDSKIEEEVTEANQEAVVPQSDAREKARQRGSRLTAQTIMLSCLETYTYQVVSQIGEKAGVLAASRPADEVEANPITTAATSVAIALKNLSDDILDSAAENEPHTKFENSGN